MIIPVSDESHCQHKCRYFFRINDININTEEEKTLKLKTLKGSRNTEGEETLKLKTLKGGRSIHSVKSTGKKGIILTRNLACFCENCLNSTGDDCKYMDKCGQWEEQSLEDQEKQQKHYP